VGQGQRRGVAEAGIDREGEENDFSRNGKATIRLVPYEIIFMDCQMPEMDCFEACRMLRLAERTSIYSWKHPAWIIALTANAMPGEREKCLAAGISDYPPKPVRASDLKNALKRSGDDRIRNPAGT
jgi:CheY-like chemotaxis protein